jgi:hypothetical protein
MESREMISMRASWPLSLLRMSALSLAAALFRI